MYLKVSSKQGMWGDARGEYWFTFADDSPHEIHLDKLDTEMRQLFQEVIREGLLLETNKDGDIIRKKRVVNIPQKPLEVKKEEKKTQVIEPYIKKRLKELLTNGVTTIRREVARMKNANIISATIKLERDGKKRKTVINLLDKQLAKSLVTSNPVLSGEQSMYNNLVEFEQGEEIEINVTDMSVESRKIEIKGE